MYQIKFKMLIFSNIQNIVQRHVAPPTHPTHTHTNGHPFAFAVSVILEFELKHLGLEPVIWINVQRYIAEYMDGMVVIHIQVHKMIMNDTAQIWGDVILIASTWQSMWWCVSQKFDHMNICCGL